MHVDPVGSADTAVIAVGSALFGITLIFIIIAWINRDFRPIRAKNLPMVTILFTTGFLWFVGDIPMNGHVLLKGAFSNCKEWNIWVRVLFCFWYTTGLIVRCYALDRVFNQNKPTRGFAYYAPSAVLVLFYLGYSIVTQAISNDKTIGYNSELELCTTTEVYVYVTVGILWVNWLIFTFMIIRLRNIQSTFNEFYESLVILAFGIAAMIKTSVVHFAHPKYPLILGYRVAETIGDAAICNGVILVIIAYPVIRSIYKSKEYERKWLLRLRTDGLQDMYETNMKLRAEVPLQYSRMNGSATNQFEKNIMEGTNDEGDFFNMHAYTEGGQGDTGTTLRADNGAYMASNELHASPRSGRNDMGVDGGSNHLHARFDRHSANSIDTMEETAKVRRIL
ncbi:hypothetical protein EV178_006387 [Coemansia sp. RSA 1646]|nr:hypothetical protein EV178_006387 [Coemansia sp. RSA 1646]KAJ1765589.1 hypothetical protein LPJ74_006288 [Coemansia sp. RSA 1843]KAJ2085356.1 hypothetical protein IW138_006372 [Coemansia sp. RSA 986]